MLRKIYITLLLMTLFQRFFPQKPLLLLASLCLFLANISIATAARDADTITINSAETFNSLIYMIHDDDSKDLIVNITDTGSVTPIDSGSSSLFSSNLISSSSDLEKYIYINNNGTLTSNSTIVTTSANSDITNSGEINASKLFYNTRNDRVTNTESGVINADIISSTYGELFVVNSGVINGDIRYIEGLGNVPQTIGITNNAGSITGNIFLSTDPSSYFTLNGGIITGNISSSDGIFYEAEAYKQTININGGTIIGNIDFDGTLNLGNNSKVIVGNLTSIPTLVVDTVGILVPSSTLNINSVTQTVTGDVSLSSGDTLAVTLDSIGSGKIAASGITTIASGVKLEVTTGSGSTYSHIADGASFTLVEGQAGSDVNQVAEEDLTVNGESANQVFKLLTFSTSIENGDDLMLNATRVSAENLSTNKNVQEAYNAINSAGGSATGKLKEFQAYLDASSSKLTIEEALRSITPQDQSSTKISSISAIQESNLAVNGRLDNLRMASLRNPPQKYDIKYRFLGASTSSFPNDKDRIKYRFLGNRISEGLNANKESSVHVWGQSFGTKSKQKDVDNDGFDSQSIGLIFGADKKINNNTHIGMALSYTDSKVNSADENKITAIDTYQVNLYGSKSYGQNFIDGILGFSWNEYDSIRSIGSVSSIAKANYNGQNYIAKLRAGSTFHKIANSKFHVTPKISTTFISSTINSYKETDADTLNLEVQANSDEYLEGKVGINIGYEPIRITRGFNVAPRINTSYGYDFLNSQQITVSNFEGQTNTFNSSSSEIDPKSIKYGAGLDIYDDKSTTLSLDYVNERKRNYVSHSGSFKAQHGF